MRRIMTALFAGAVAFAPFAAVAQSGQDTGAGKPDAATTNSGQARPDSTTNRGVMPHSANPSTSGAPTSGTDGTGSGMARPDSDPSSRSSGGVKASEPTKAAPTDTKN